MTTNETGTTAGPVSSFTTGDFDFSTPTEFHVLLVGAGGARLIRRRETLEDLVRSELDSSTQRTLR